MTESVQKLIADECDALKQMLIEKNRAYGNSALDPVRIFSRADASEQIRVRIDDKLSRLKRGRAAGEDAVVDLMGYLVLLRVAEKLRRNLDAVATAEALDYAQAVADDGGTNDEGMTFGEWAAAAGLGAPAPAPWMLLAWHRGEDPSEHRVNHDQRTMELVLDEETR